MQTNQIISSGGTILTPLHQSRWNLLWKSRSLVCFFIQNFS